MLQHGKIDITTSSPRFEFIDSMTTTARSASKQIVDMRAPEHFRGDNEEPSSGKRTCVLELGLVPVLEFAFTQSVPTFALTQVSTRICLNSDQDKYSCIFEPRRFLNLVIVYQKPWRVRHNVFQWQKEYLKLWGSRSQYQARCEQDITEAQEMCTSRRCETKIQAVLKRHRN